MNPSWVERDAAVVWHGFTQMDSYADNAPVIVDTASGHELVGVDGRRYLDAISSLWVNTVGHQVPELDDALGDGGFGTDIFDPLRFAVHRAPGFDDPNCFSHAAAMVARRAAARRGDRR